MTFHFPIKLNRGSNSAQATALSVNQLPVSGINCDCAYILNEQVANQMPGLYLHDGLAWRFALNKEQLDSCVIFGRGIELYYRLEEDIEITTPALIFRNTLPVQGTVLDDGSTAVFAVVLLPTGYDPSGLAPLFSPAFVGVPTAPTASTGTNTTQLATTEFVVSALAALPEGGVVTFNQRTGNITLLTQDIVDALGYTPVDPAAAVLTGAPTAPTAVIGTSTDQLATTSFVGRAIAAIPPTGVFAFNNRTGAVSLVLSDVTGAGGAPLFSPAFAGVPTSPTPAAGDATGKIATTAFVEAAISVLPPGGVESFNSRVGEIVLQLSDVIGVGGAPLANPSFTGVPRAATATLGTSSTQLATTAFVANALASLPPPGVASFNSRTGAVTLTLADVTAVGGAPTASPTFTGLPKAPTPTAGDNSTSLATTAFVQAALAGSVAGVESFNSRSGTVTLELSDVTAVGGAPVESPALTGIPTAPTAAQDNSSTQLATTAFVQGGRSLSAMSDVELLTPTEGQVLTYQDGVWVNANNSADEGVLSFNNRTGIVTLSEQDVVTALGYTPPETSVDEAPVDGKLYGRKDAAWSEVNLPDTVLGPLQSVTGEGLVSVIEDSGEGTGVATLRAFQSSPTIVVRVENGVIAFDSPSAVNSVAGVLPVDGDVPLTASDLGALPLAGGTMTGPLNMGGVALTGLRDPVGESDAVTLRSLSLTTFDAGEY